MILHLKFFLQRTFLLLQSEKNIIDLYLMIWSYEHPTCFSPLRRERQGRDLTGAEIKAKRGKSGLKKKVIVNDSMWSKTLDFGPPVLRTFQSIFLGKPCHHKGLLTCCWFKVSSPLSSLEVIKYIKSHIFYIMWI